VDREVKEPAARGSVGIVVCCPARSGSCWTGLRPRGMTMVNPDWMTESKLRSEGHAIDESGRRTVRGNAVRLLCINCNRWWKHLPGSFGFLFRSNPEANRAGLATTSILT
jgi:hypothetical protein